MSFVHLHFLSSEAHPQEILRLGAACFWLDSFLTSIFKFFSFAQDSIHISPFFSFCLSICNTWRKTANWISSQEGYTHEIKWSTWKVSSDLSSPLWPPPLFAPSCSVDFFYHFILILALGAVLRFLPSACSALSLLSFFIISFWYNI